MYPYQLDQIVALARKQPDLQIMINYCASPINRDTAGMHGGAYPWRNSAPNWHRDKGLQCGGLRFGPD